MATMIQEWQLFSRLAFATHSHLLSFERVTSSMSQFESAHNPTTLVQLDDFLAYVLPPLQHEFDVAQITETLAHPETNANPRTARAISSNGRWRGFPVDPAASYLHEKNVYRHLRAIVLAILRASGSRNTPVSFHHNPLCIMSAESRQHNEDYMPDAYFAVKPNGGWEDMVAFGELRKTGSEYDVQENNAKVTGSMARCFSRDPRRRFLYAFTIQDTSMNLWFCDRSQILVTTPFNFVTDHEPFVHFALALMYASPENYGLDPTMTSIPGDTHRYDIIIRAQQGPPRLYRTLEVLSEQEVILGKGTRVWKAVEICEGKETGSPMALKDSWVDPRRAQEGTIYERLLADTSMAQDSTPSSPFLTVECHGDVYLENNGRGVLDCTRTLDLQGNPTNGMHIASRSEIMDEPADAEAPQKRLVHYRAVFREVCRPLSDERSLPVIFRTLSEAALALKQLHAAGWVHRDVSIDNIFIDDDGKTLLGDLECARKMGTEEESRIGTARFMAIEVEAQEYLFKALPDPPPASVLRKKYPDMTPRIEQYEERSRAKTAKLLNFKYDDSSSPPPEEPERVDPPFRYNPLHDLESIWWIAAYFVLKKEIVDPRAESHVASAAQRTIAADLFRHGIKRQEPWRFEFSLKGIIESLPSIPRHLAEGLGTLRRELLCRYFVEEMELESIDHTCASQTHEAYSKILLRIANRKRYQDLTVRSFTYVEDPTPVDGSYGYNEDHWSVPSPYRTKRRRSITPSDTSIDYSQFKKAKMERAVDPDQAGVPSRSRPFLARKAKRPVRRRMVASDFVRLP